MYRVGPGFYVRVEAFKYDSILYCRVIETEVRQLVE